MNKVANLIQSFKHAGLHPFFNDIMDCDVRKNPGGLSEYQKNGSGYVQNQLFVLLIGDEGVDWQSFIDELSTDVHDFLTCPAFNEKYMLWLSGISSKLHDIVLKDKKKFFKDMVDMEKTISVGISLNTFLCDKDINNVMMSIYGCVPNFNEMGVEEKEFFFLNGDSSQFCTKPDKNGTK